MALIPTWYSASTKQIAEKALQRGVLLKVEWIQRKAKLLL